MSSAVSVERQKMITAFGAKVILTGGGRRHGRSDTQVRAAARWPSIRINILCPTSSPTRYNKVAHYSTTAEEMIRDTRGAHHTFRIGAGAPRAR